MPDIATFVSSLDSTTLLTLSLRVALAYVCLLWAAIIVWVARDVISRTRRLGLHVAALALVIFLNIFGLIIYLIVRPQKTLVERYYEELEQKALADNPDACPACARELPPLGRYCPTCGTEVRVPCESCKKLVAKTWARCAYCGVDCTATVNVPTKKTSRK